MIREILKSFKNGNISIDYALMSISDYYGRSKDEIIQKYVNSVIDLVCKGNGVLPIDVLGRTRQQNIVYCRYIIWHYLYKISDPKLSLEKVGKFVGDRGHDTVLNGLKQFEILKNYPDFKQMIINSGFEI